MGPQLAFWKREVCCRWPVDRMRSALMQPRKLNWHWISMSFVQYVLPRTMLSRCFRWCPLWQRVPTSLKYMFIMKSHLQWVFFNLLDNVACRWILKYINPSIDEGTTQTTKAIIIRKTICLTCISMSHFDFGRIIPLVISSLSQLT